MVLQGEPNCIEKVDLTQRELAGGSINSLHWPHASLHCAVISNPKAEDCNYRSGAGCVIA
jgi:hypothetical protein